MHIDVTAESFENEVLKSDSPVIVDFWAEWCGPCRMTAPVLEEISEEYPEVKLCKINVDDEGELANRYGVTAIPTVLLFKNGEPIATSVGYFAKDELVKKLGLA